MQLQICARMLHAGCHGHCGWINVWLSLMLMVVAAWALPAVLGGCSCAPLAYVPVADVAVHLATLGTN